MAQCRRGDLAVLGAKSNARCGCALRRVAHTRRAGAVNWESASGKVLVEHLLRLPDAKLSRRFPGGSSAMPSRISARVMALTKYDAFCCWPNQFCTSVDSLLAFKVRKMAGVRAGDGWVSIFGTG